MPLLLNEELAKQLDLPVDDVSNALSELLGSVKSDIDNNQPAEMPGIGTFERKEESISFTPSETLALSVNNRYAALDAEMIQLGFEEPDFPLSETLEEGNDQEVDQSLIDQIIADDMASQGLFKDDDKPDPNPVSIDEKGLFASDPEENELDKSNSPTPDAQSSEQEVDSSSMKEDDPNSENRSKEDPQESDTEWSPFFEELEGEEFDIDNTIDLSAEDWQAEIPPPPSSPFASSSDSSNTNADDLYFDVDADPDDTLFAPAASIDVENPSASDDLSWASAPLDDVTDFFEDDPSASSSFGEEIDALSAMSAEDEFFSPVSGSIDVSPDDTMFSAESLYSEDASTEADDTIFLAPEQTIQDATIASESDVEDIYAPPDEQDDAPSPPHSRNPYAYHEQHKKQKASGGFPWVALLLGAIVIFGGAGVSYWQGWLPFGGNTPETPRNVTTTPPVVPPAQDPQQATDPATNPTTDPASAAATDGTNTAEDPQLTTPQVTAPPSQPVVQRLNIDRTKGGFTIIVSSEEQRASAEQIADDFAENLDGLRLPIDILVTNDFANTRYRIGVGQFATRNEARAFLNRSASELPGDAWLLKIE